MRGVAFASFAAVSVVSLVGVARLVWWVGQYMASTKDEPSEIRQTRKRGYV